MSSRNVLLKRDLLSFIGVRRTLRDVADVLSNLEADEARKYLKWLQEDIEMLRNGDLSSAAWKQACGTMNGPSSYGLQRLGFLPDLKCDS